MGRTNELNVACEVACEDETARMSEGDVGPVLVVLKHNRRRWVEMWFSHERDDGVDWYERLAVPGKTRHTIAEMVLQGQPGQVS